MQKTFLSLGILAALFLGTSQAEQGSTAKASGEVVTVDPLYSRITIETGAIVGYTSGGKVDFEVASKNLLEGLSARDRVTFELSGDRHQAKITQITKTGTASQKDKSTPIGKVAQEVLGGAGEVVKTVTSPIPPVRATVGEAVGAAAEGTGNLVSEAKSDLKRDF